MARATATMGPRAIAHNTRRRPHVRAHCLAAGKTRYRDAGAPGQPQQPDPPAVAAAPAAAQGATAHGSFAGDVALSCGKHPREHT